jgi:hypothetical protein
MKSVLDFSDSKLSGPPLFLIYHVRRCMIARQGKPHNSEENGTLIMITTPTVTNVIAYNYFTANLPPEYKGYVAV